MDWIWIVVAGVALAAFVATGKFLLRAIAHEIVEIFREEFNIEEMQDDLRYVKNELTINGGVTVKDRIFSIERQLEQIIIDR